MEYTFKDIDFWIILGDLNFRIDLTYEDAITLIKQKKYDILYSLDQFNTSKESNEFLKSYIKEKEINFEPTYKYVKGLNEYAYDEDKIRVPAWTDRIFYCKNKKIKMLTYDSIRSIKFSDHRPVVGTFLINIKNKNNFMNNNNDNNNVKMNSYNNINNKNDNNLIYKDNNYNDNYINNDKEKEKEKINKKKKEHIKMNYRGINFNTEIEIDYEDKNQYKKNNDVKQNIYDFFVDKRKLNNINLI